MEQTFVLHEVVSDKFAAHATPPCCASATIERERERIPPPHETVHALQGVNVDIVQSTGHG